MYIYVYLSYNSLKLTKITAHKANFARLLLRRAPQQGPNGSICRQAVDPVLLPASEAQKSP